MYPVGLTEVRLQFMHKIAYNSFNVDQIYPQIDAGICLRPPIHVPNFNKIKARSYTHELWWFCKVYEMTKKKRRNFTEILLTYIFGTAWGILIQFETWPLLYGGQLHCKFGAIWISHHGAIDAWKSRFCCSCQYTHCVCARPIFLGRMTHYRVPWLEY